MSEVIENKEISVSSEEQSISAPKVEIENIPQELKEPHQWVLWKSEQSESGKPKKVPYSTRGHKASPTNSKTWDSFDSVVSVYEENPGKYAGIGFVFSKNDSFVGIDWDNVRDASSDKWDQSILLEIGRLNTYSEISPSGTGAHAILIGELDPNGMHRSGNREIYEDGRFFTFTGNVIEGMPLEINEDSRSLEFIQEKVGYKTTQSSSEEFWNNNTNEIDEIISRCESSASKAKFKSLFYDGNLKDYNGDHSRADIALCDILAYYTQDEKLIDHIFKQSALYREKWDRADYSHRTIRNAIDFIDSKRNWEDYKAPHGYNINERGLFKNNFESGNGQRICRTPIVISGIGEDLDNDECWYQVTFKDPTGKTKQEYMKQDKLMKKSGVMEISNRGVLITEKKANDLCEYFVDSIAEIAPKLEKKPFVRNNGWKRDNEAFAIGERLHTKDEVTKAVQINAKKTAGLNPKGSLENWIDAVKGVIIFPDIRLKCYTALSSLLLRAVNADSFFLDHSGNTTAGKSFGVQVAISMLGDPKALKLAGNSTATYLEGRATMFNDLPLFIDETSLVDADQLSRVIYQITNETGKGRGNTDGSIQDLNEWKTVGMSTGEKSIVDHNGFSGQEVRVIKIHDDLPYMKEQVDYTKKVLKNNYGHVIDYFIRNMFENMENLEPKYEGYISTFTTGKSKTADRLANSFAVIAVAGELLEEVFKEIGIEPVDSTELVQQYFNKCVLDKPIELYGIKALRIANDWIESNRFNFIEDNDQESFRGDKIYGWVDSKGYFDIIPSELEKELVQHGIKYTDVRDDWIKWNVMIVSKGRNDYRANHTDAAGKSSRPSVCRIDIEKIHHLLENGLE
ncbi:protein of unknown function [Methanolobus vulcani]|uniref:DUF927 domain-containing protein n=1 Tax=Methanolobus vulcani TaxID=38026 RepID=A0A7Z7FEN9_9EURY|nr:DUF927 domain-containing protein [Methanolobus vulcani]SDF93663.1 protein of unknown function [Methanolobus vulcani]